MDAIVVKILATALTLSQVVTKPDAIKPAFDPARDRGQVIELLRAGCSHMRRTFDLEDINLDELIATAMADPKEFTGEVKAFRGINFTEMHTLYKQFCGKDPADPSADHVTQTIDFYNKAVADLPDHTKFKDGGLPGTSVVLDGRGQQMAEIFQPGHRREPVALGKIPKWVQQAFVAAEDKRFYEHRGLDERSVVRAFVGTLAGKREGGSTITQQVAKNVLVGDDFTYERKMREMIIAARLERTLTKDRILELYLNSIYFGRGAWGIELAARSYFGKPASALTLSEGVLLAAIIKGPNYYAPDKHPDRARQRYAYVLSRMQEDGEIAAAQLAEAVKSPPVPIPYSAPHNDFGFYAVAEVTRGAKSQAGVEELTAGAYTVRSTINAEVQRATELALQDGLARYEVNSGRSRFTGAEVNLADAVRRHEAEQGSAGTPAWQRALEGARLPLYDVHWTPAIVVERAEGKKGAVALRVGLKGGRVLPLSTNGTARLSGLKRHDVVYVQVAEATGKKSASALLRIRPAVQGATLVLENRTGRILATAGGFSFPLSQLNRSTQSFRQPGSVLKPLTYLAALNSGLQPNTLVWDSPITLRPIGTVDWSRPQDSWTPKNYDDASSGPITLRSALESSKNLVTVRLLEAITSNAEDSLDRVCELALEGRLYTECVRYYPFVLGAQPLRLLDVAAFYAAVANEGARPTPYVVESIQKQGETVYTHKAEQPAWIGSADRATFYQLKSILQGVVARGTARTIKHLAPFVAGKTGTTDNENDAWFVGFTNDVTVVVWVGYDNAGGQRRTLGGGHTGAKIAVPIFADIIEAAWAHHAPKAALLPASLEAQRNLVARTIDLKSGDEVGSNVKTAFVEQFRRDRWGEVNDTQFRLVPRDEAVAYHQPEQPWWFDGDGLRRPGDGYGAYNGPMAQAPWWRAVPVEPPPGAWRRYSYPPPRWGYDDRRRERRADPDYFWGFGRMF